MQLHVSALCAGCRWRKGRAAHVSLAHVVKQHSRGLQQQEVACSSGTVATQQSQGQPPCFDAEKQEHIALGLVAQDCSMVWR